MPPNRLIVRCAVVLALLLAPTVGAKADTPTAEPGLRHSSTIQREAPPVAASRLARALAQSSGLTTDFFIGSWRTENVEFGNTVEIIWSLFRDGRLAYEFNVNGQWYRGSTGTWVVEGDVVIENWVREDGSRGTGRGRIEKIDDNTISLTIEDNGASEYQGLVRIYRRIGPPQLS